MSGSSRERRSEEMTQSNISSQRWSKVPFEFERVGWQLKSPRIKRFLEEREKESGLLSVGEERIGG